MIYIMQTRKALSVLIIYLYIGIGVLAPSVVNLVTIFCDCLTPSKEIRPKLRATDPHLLDMSW